MNYGALKTAVSAWSNRSDLTAQMGAFVLLAEQRIYSGDPANGVEPLRLSGMLVTASLTPTAGVIALPAGAEVLRVREASTRLVLNAVSEDKFGAIEGMTGSRAYVFNVRGGSLRVGPSMSGALEVTYYARPATPSADSDENAVMLAYPAIYLHAMLIEAGLYLSDDDMTVRALKAFSSAHAGAMQADRRAESGGLAALAVRSDAWGMP